MLRPATLLRTLAVPARQLRPHAAVSTLPFASRYLSTETSPSSTSTSSTPPPPQPSSPSEASSAIPPTSQAPTNPVPQQQPQQQTARRLFHVDRTPSNQLAVYQLAKRGGNKHLTVIKKVEGDRAAFLAALEQALGLAAKQAHVNTLTGHVVVSGHRRTEVVGWLEKLGF